MSLVDSFFGTILSAKLEEPILVTLDLKDGQEATSAIIIPRIDPDGGVLLDLYGDVEQKNELSGYARLAKSGYDRHPITVRLPQGRHVEAIVSKLSMNSATARLVLATQEVVVKDCPLNRAAFCIQDFPLFLGEGAVHFHNTLHGSIALGRSEIKADGWNIVIEESTEVGKDDWGVTHRGFISRIDGNDFSIADVNHLRGGLTYFLTFVTGVYRTPTVIIGYDVNGEQVWGRIGMFNQYKYHEDNWFSRFQGASLATLFPGFWQCFNNDMERISNAIDLYTESSMIAHMKYIMYKNALKDSQSALEGLATLVLGRNRRKEERTSDYITESLKKTNIGCELSEFPHLLDLWHSKYKNPEDDNAGPTFIARLRNRYTHPTSKELDVMDYYEVWKLSHRYAELLLLHLFTYNGQYRDRLTSNVNLVPWAIP